MLKMICVTAVLSLSACGSKKEAHSGAESLAAAGLAGTFVQGCKPSGSYSVIGTLNFFGNIETGSTNVYLDTTCSSLGYSFSLRGTFASGAATTNPVGASIYTIYSFSGDSLFMGQIGTPSSSADGSSDANRPVSLGSAFVRQ